MPIITACDIAKLLLLENFISPVSIIILCDTASSNHKIIVGACGAGYPACNM